VVAHKAESLLDLNMMSAMDPYLMAILIPGSAETTSACSTSCEGGGVAPVWDDGINETLDNKLLLPEHGSPTSLALEIWDENTAMDEKIGTVTIPIQGVDVEKEYGGMGKREWHKVDTGGRLEVTVMFSEPVTERNVSLGARCTRGLHWICGKHDGGQGGLGASLSDGFWMCVLGNGWLSNKSAWACFSLTHTHTHTHTYTHV
jgi:hypothetical protein